MLALGRGYGIRAAADDGVSATRRLGRRAALRRGLRLGQHGARVARVPAPRLRVAAAAPCAGRVVGAMVAPQCSMPRRPAMPVYVQEGFGDTWGFARYRREAPQGGDAAMSGGTTRATARERLAGDRRARCAGIRCQPRCAAARAGAAPAGGRAGRGGGRARDRLRARPRRPRGLPDRSAGRGRRHRGQTPARRRAARAAPGRCTSTCSTAAARCCRGWWRTALCFQRPFTRMVHGRRDAPGDPATGRAGGRSRTRIAVNRAGPAAGRARISVLLRHLDRPIEELVGVDRLHVERLVDADVLLAPGRSRRPCACRRGCRVPPRARTCRSSAPRPAASCPARCRT